MAAMMSEALEIAITKEARRDVIVLRLMSDSQREIYHSARSDKTCAEGKENILPEKPEFPAFRL